MRTRVHKEAKLDYTVGVIGLGNMGIGMAKNLIKAGFQTVGYDVRKERLDLLRGLGGTLARSCAEVGEKAETVIVMVFDASQVEEAVLGETGLIHTMSPEKTIIVSSTIEAQAARRIAKELEARGINVLDAPVTGGKSGAEEGTLTIMVAGPKAVLEKNAEVFQAVAKKVIYVGEEIGQGQTMKAVLQAVVGATFGAVFEALVLGAKAGIKGEILYDVLSESVVGSPLLKNCARLILDRKFKDTGSHIGTMYKDFGITLAVARENQVPMPTTSAAFQLFQAGIAMFPDEDNWACVKVLESIVGTEVKW